MDAVAIGAIVSVVIAIVILVYLLIKGYGLIFKEGPGHGK